MKELDIEFLLEDNSPINAVVEYEIIRDSEPHEVGQRIIWKNRIELEFRAKFWSGSKRYQPTEEESEAWHVLIEEAIMKEEYL